MNTVGIDPAQHDRSPPPGLRMTSEPTPIDYHSTGPNVDLLLHLLANLDQAIVLVGAKGSGKTSTLRQLQAKAHGSWTVCYVSCSANLTFQHVLGEMIQLFRKPGSDLPGTAAESLLDEQLAAISRQQRILVLLLDDAGVLMPGLLSAICQFARQHPAMRLMFAINPENLSAIAVTDALAIRHAREIRLPSPADAPMRVFEGRSQSSPEPIPKNSGSEGLLGRLTRSHLSGQIVLSVRTLWLYCAILLACLAGLAFAFLRGMGAQVPVLLSSVTPVAPQQAPATPTVPPPLPSALEQAVQQTDTGSTTESPRLAAIDHHAETAAQLPEAPNTNQPPAATTPPEPARTSSGPEIIVQQTPISKPTETNVQLREGEPKAPAETKRSASRLKSVKKPPEEARAAEIARTEKPRTTKPEKSTRTAKDTKKSIQGKASPPTEKPKPPPLAKPSGNLMSGVKDAHWLMRQNPISYTLQLIAVSQFDALTGFIQQVPASDKLASFRAQKESGGGLYPLFYGIYPSLSAAKDAAKRLPSAVGKPFPRAIRSVQEEILRMTPHNADPTAPFNDDGPHEITHQ